MFQGLGRYSILQCANQRVIEAVDVAFYQQNLRIFSILFRQQNAFTVDPRDFG